jgi:hypothetical protein
MSRPGDEQHIPSPPPRCSKNWQCMRSGSNISRIVGSLSVEQVRTSMFEQVPSPPLTSPHDLSVAWSTPLTPPGQPVAACQAIWPIGVWQRSDPQARYLGGRQATVPIHSWPCTQHTNEDVSMRIRIIMCCTADHQQAPATPASGCVK